MENDKFYHHPSVIFFPLSLTLGDILTEWKIIIHNHFAIDVELIACKCLLEWDREEELGVERIMINKLIISTMMNSIENYETLFIYNNAGLIVIDGAKWLEMMEKEEEQQHQQHCKFWTTIATQFFCKSSDFSLIML